MSSRTGFISAHRAKLSWKIIKHGLGVVVGREEREGRAGDRDPESEAYIDIPLHV